MSTPPLELPKRSPVSQRHEKQAIRVSAIVVDSSSMAADRVYDRLGTRAGGLTAEEGSVRLAEHGPNVLAKDRRPGFAKLLWHSVLNPLVILLGVLATISFATACISATTFVCGSVA